jgi:hypothetical protein
LPPSEVTGSVSACARQRPQSVPHRRCEFVRLSRRACTGGHDATGQRKQILDAVVQLAQRQAKRRPESRLSFSLVDLFDDRTLVRLNHVGSVVALDIAILP